MRCVEARRHGNVRTWASGSFSGACSRRYEGYYDMITRTREGRRRVERLIKLLILRGFGRLSSLMLAMLNFDLLQTRSEIDRGIESELVSSW
jgi:hypothetical protein